MGEEPGHLGSGPSSALSHQGPRECLCPSLSPVCLPAGVGPSHCQPVAVALQPLDGDDGAGGADVGDGLHPPLPCEPGPQVGHRHILG